MTNPIWKHYLSEKIPYWKLCLVVVPETIIKTELNKPIKNNVNSIMGNQKIMDILFDKKFFLNIKNKYGEKGIRASFDVTVDDILDELKTYTSHKKIKLIYDYLKRNKSSFGDIINNLKKGVSGKSHIIYGWDESEHKG